MTNQELIATTYFKVQQALTALVKLSKITDSMPDGEDKDNICDCLKRTTRTANELDSDICELYRCTQPQYEPFATPA